MGTKIGLFLQMSGKTPNGTEEGGEVRRCGSEEPGPGERTLARAEARVAVVFESLVFAVL